MDPAPVSKNHWVYKVLIAIILVNALVTAYLFNIVMQQQKRIQTLERNDAITQSVDKLNTKVQTLKEKVQGLFK